MNHSNVANSDPAGSFSQDAVTALFANLVVYQSNMALMFLGKVAHPETGQTFTDPETARMFIDQLEMLRIKTKGNLSPEETAFLKQSLMALQLAYVEAVNAAPVQSTATSSAAIPPPPASATPPPPTTPAGTEETNPPKFSKKY